MWEIIGHEWAVKLLESSIRQDNIANAYLFTGPDGVGKRTLALELARALCCRNGPPPCGECRDCKDSKLGQHPDITVLEPQNNRIRIDQVRELKRKASLAPYRSRYRIYIIIDMETATPEAANSLLKILEEPPEHLVMVLTAPGADVLPPTIVSRCQVVNLRPLPVATTARALQDRWGLGEEEAALLARISTGRLGLAVRMAQDPNFRAKRAQDLEALLEVLHSDVVERFEWVASLKGEQAIVQQMLERWLTGWRDMALLAEGAPERVINVDFIPKLEPLAQKLGGECLRRGIQDIRSTIQAINKNANLRLALEVLMLNLPRIHLKEV